VKIGLEIVNKSRTEQLTFDVRLLACGGWSGRDRSSVMKHVEELEKLGVARPSKVPALFPVSRYLLTQEDEIEVPTHGSSGEVEYVVLIGADAIYVTVGSDHTDRELEKFSVEKSKQACPKIIAKQGWLFEDVRNRWDEIMLRSYATRGRKRFLYQEATLGSLIDLDSLLNQESGRYRSEGSVVFSGTIPTREGIVFLDQFEIEMRDPQLSRSITHSYRIKVLAGKDS
jgi:hypothetical protein